MDLIAKYLGFYRDGMGGLNSHGVWLSFDLENINKRVRSVYITKITAFIVEMVEQQKKEVDTFKKDPKNG